LNTLVLQAANLRGSATLLIAMTIPSESINSNMTLVFCWACF